MSAIAAHRDFIATAAEALGDDGVGTRAIYHNEGCNRRRPPRLLIDVAHAAQIALALFADIADEQQWRAVFDFGRGERSGDGEQSRDAGRVVGDAGSVELV